MVKQKHHVFSARTTGEGLRLLNGIRKERGIGWDDLVIDGSLRPLRAGQGGDVPAQ